MSDRRGSLADVVICLVWFVTAGVLGAVAWAQLAPTPVATQTEGGAALQGQQLELQVGIDGWFGAVALVLGLLSGLALLTWRSRRPELMVLLVALGAGLSAVLMVRGGSLLGPPDPADVLAGADVGAQAPLDLTLQATGMAWLWPVAAVAGALVQLLVLRRADGEEPGETPSESDAGPADHPDDAARIAPGRPAPG
ncbi:hypothetical protein [Nocardioides aequoreus]|uniref:hypothetical protein n=1 Tax=Nocardioides aequoreus TaxID=397278 RepID=UPI00068F3C79|nr:hypothetical protein [Nocardioides aequoreus]